MRPNWISLLFALAALYDTAAGLLLWLAYRPLYHLVGMPPPAEPPYLEFGAVSLIVLGIGLWLVARDPSRNRGIILMGILTKLAFVGIVLLQRIHAHVPPIWGLLAWIDFAFVAAFFGAQRSLHAQDRQDVDPRCVRTVRELSANIGHQPF